MVRAVDGAAARGDRACAKERLQPRHDAGAVLDQIDVQASELFELRALWHGGVIHRAHRIALQCGRELLGVVPITLVGRPPHLAPIAYDDARDQGNEQIVEPLRLRAFFEGHVHTATDAAEEFRERHRIRRHDRARDHTRTLLAHNENGGILVHIEPRILRRPFHESRSWL